MRRMLGECTRACWQTRMRRLEYDRSGANEPGDDLLD